MEENRVIIYNENQIKSVLKMLDTLEMKGIGNISRLMNVVQTLGQGQELNESDITIKQAEEGGDKPLD